MACAALGLSHTCGGCRTGIPYLVQKDGRPPMRLFIATQAAAERTRGARGSAGNMRCRRVLRVLADSERQCAGGRQCTCRIKQAVLPTVRHVMNSASPSSGEWSGPACTGQLISVVSISAHRSIGCITECQYPVGAATSSQPAARAELPITHRSAEIRHPPQPPHGTALRMSRKGTARHGRPVSACRSHRCDGIHPSAVPRHS